MPWAPARMATLTPISSPLMFSSGPPELPGLMLASVDGEAVARVNRQLHGGLEVVGVDAEGVAARAGIRRGDILVGLHQWETLTVDNVAYVLTHPDLPSLNPLSFHIVRSGQIRRGWLQNVD